MSAYYVDVGKCVCPVFGWENRCFSLINLKQIRKTHTSFTPINKNKQKFPNFLLVELIYLLIVVATLYNQQDENGLR